MKKSKTRNENHLARPSKSLRHKGTGSIFRNQLYEGRLELRSSMQARHPDRYLGCDTVNVNAVVGPTRHSNGLLKACGNVCAKRVEKSDQAMQTKRLKSSGHVFHFVGNRRLITCWPSFFPPSVSFSEGEEEEPRSALSRHALYSFLPVMVHIPLPLQFSTYIQQSWLYRRELGFANEDNLSCLRIIIN